MDEPAHSLHVLGGAGHELARLLAVVVGVGEALEAVVDAVAQVVGHALGNPLAKVGLEEGEGAAQGGRAYDGQGGDDQRLGIAVGDQTAALHLGPEAEVDGPANELRDGQDEAAGRDHGQEGEGRPLLVGAEEGQKP